ncbi:MAG: hypothetical protein HOP24_09190 [Sideroxydans sp.]|nr:hypothetical protein [Sideroxydans sp.]
MDIFFDTEFSGTEKTKGHRYLISIGCVSSEGHEFYAELTDTWDESLCSFFTIANVLPLLQGGVFEMGLDELAVRLKNWVENLTEEQVTFRSDAPNFDWPFLQEIFGFIGWPRNLNRQCGTIFFEDELQQLSYDRALEDYWKSPVHAQLRHHALIDAKSLRFAWWHATASEMSEDKFQELISSLMQIGLGDGGNGYRYWSGVVANLKKLRTLAVNK